MRTEQQTAIQLLQTERALSLLAGFILAHDPKQQVADALNHVRAICESAHMGIINSQPSQTPASDAVRARIAEQNQQASTAALEDLPEKASPPPTVKSTPPAAKPEATSGRQYHRWSEEERRQMVFGVKTLGLSFEELGQQMHQPAKKLKVQYYELSRCGLIAQYNRPPAPAQVPLQKGESAGKH